MGRSCPLHIVGRYRPLQWAAPAHGQELLICMVDSGQLLPMGSSCPWAVSSFAWQIAHRQLLPMGSSCPWAAPAHAWAAPAHGQLLPMGTFIGGKLAF